MKRPGHIKVLQLALMCCLGVQCSLAQAQSPLSNLVVTVGTTIQDGSGKNWSYVVIGSTEYQLLSGKQFAVYAKPGYPTNAGTYTFRANIFQQSDSNAVNTLLNQSVSLGENLTKLSSELNLLFAQPNTNLSNPQFNPSFAALSLPQQVLTCFQAGAVNPTFAQTIGLLAHLHPGLLLCLGQGFSEMITNVTTYEVRDINPATGLAAEVVGRVTIMPGSPAILPAPGTPFQVLTGNSTDNLRIRLRWGTSDVFRRLSLLSFGFDVWRVAATNAVALGYNVSPPSPSQLGNGYFTLANMSPVMATKDFTTNSGTGGANDSADGTTYFFSDNNGRPLGYIPQTTGRVPSDYTNLPSFNDGQQFYYFVTARDLLGREGFLSPGGFAEACRRIPPNQPTNVAVQNTFKVLNAATLSNQQYFTITWQQDLATNDQVTEYWVYRWPDPALALTNDTVATNCRIAVVTQVPGAPTGLYADTGPGSPQIPGTTNYWYTVRAVSQAACGPLLSPNSTPVWGVLRERVGPAAAKGELLGSCGSPAVLFQNFQTNSVSVGSPPQRNLNYLLTVQRLDPGTAWVQFFVTNQAGVATTLGPTYFPPDNNTLQIAYAVPAFASPGLASSNQLVGIACVAGTEYGLLSAPVAVAVTSVPAYTSQLQVNFMAGQVMLTSLTPTNLLLAALAPGGCQPALGATAYPDGTVRMAFNYVGAPPLMLIQALVTNTWKYVGVAAADPNGNYSIFYPACLLGPLPSFQGCPLNLPTEGDCSQHISAGGPGSPVNPVQVTFTITPGTAEFRLYRTVNSGLLTLIAQGAATYNQADVYATIVRNDDAMPPSEAQLCYYVQLLDIHGNAGPLAFLGCKDVKPAELPTPVLSQPQSAGTIGDPRVNLNWFCPTSGVYRYEILVSRTDHPFGSGPLDFSANNLTLVQGDLLNTFLGLIEDNPSSVLQFDGYLLTPPAGAAFEPGPSFTLTANVATNASYDIAVAALDDQGNAGPVSKAWKFTWQAASDPSRVPWPARPLPAVNAFDDVAPPSGTIQPRVAAVLLYDPHGVLDATYPVGIRIGDLSPAAPGGSPVLNPNIGTTNFLSYYVYNSGPASPTLDPNSMIFSRRSQNSQRQGNSLLPIVIYRQQVANAAFPKVTGAVIQVTPLIERLAYGTNGPNSFPLITVYDLLIAGGTEASGGKIGEFLYLRDQQPVLLGAAYQYFLVRMNAQREVTEIIPAGTVIIPATPP